MTNNARAEFFAHGDTLPAAARSDPGEAAHHPSPRPALVGSRGPLTRLKRPYTPPKAAQIRQAIGALTVTHPLPTDDSLPDAVRGLAGAADQEIARGRLESALDLTILAQSLAPRLLALHIRQIELLAATGREDCALRLGNALLRDIEWLDGDDARPAVDRVLTHLQPTASNVIRLAGELLRAGRTDIARQYLPVAVNLLIDEARHDEAITLARRWQEADPADAEALFVWVRELLRAGRAREAREAVEGAAAPAESAPARVARLAAFCLAGAAGQWRESLQLERQIRADRLDPYVVLPLLGQVIAMLPAAVELRIHLGLLELAAGRTSEALRVLHPLMPGEPVAAAVAAAATARAAAAATDTQIGLAALIRLHELLETPEVQALADDPETSGLLAGIDQLTRDVAALLLKRGQPEGAARLLEHAARLAPDDPDLLRGHALAVSQAGRREEAIATLTSLLSREEQTGNLSGSVKTLRAMIQVTPGSLKLRERLVERFMTQGRLEDAGSELHALAAILARAGRPDEALARLRRAAEVALLSGDWTLVDRIYRSMIELRPRDLDVRHAAVTTFIQCGQMRRAVDQLREVVGISLERKDVDSAVAALHQIIALAPTDTAAYQKLAEVLASVGEFAQAERVYRRLCAMHPDDAALRARHAAVSALARGQA